MRRWFGSPTAHRRRPFYGLVSALALIALLGMQAGALAKLQATLDGPSPATGHASVIAQGVAEMPSDPIAWRIVHDTAEPLDTALPVERALGFVAAEPDGVHVVDETTGTQVRLAPGEASFVSESAVQVRASLTDANTSYLRIALVAEADANDAGSDELVFAGKAFAAPQGRRDIDLVRDVLAQEEESQIAGGDEPVLVMATAGSINVSADAEPVELKQGEAAEFTGDLTITGLGDGSAFIAGVIGPEVPVPPRTSGSITLGVHLCPPGVAASDLGDTLDEKAAAGCEPVSDGFAATLVTPSGDELTLDDADSVKAGVSAWLGLPFGDYSISDPSKIPDGAGDPTFYDGEGNHLDSSDITIDRDTPDVHLDLYLFQAGQGSVSVTVYNCPSGWTPENGDPAACEAATEGFDITLSDTSQNNTTLTLDDAEAKDNAFVWSNLGLSEDANTLTAGYYVIDEPTLPDGYNAFTTTGTTTSDGQGGFASVNLTADAPTAEVGIYNWVTENPTGTITVDTVVCPSADSSPESCSRQFGPSGVGGIFIQDVNGENAALTEANASHEGDGPYVWTQVPLASYSMDTSGLTAPDGYDLVSVLLTPDGADVSGGFELNQDISIANIVVVLTPMGGVDSTPTTDADSDGLADDQEVAAATDVNNPDTDGDCHADGAEVAAGSDPLDAASFPEGDCDLIESTGSN